MKLGLCGSITSASKYPDPTGTLSIFPNPASEWVYLRSNDEVLRNEDITIEMNEVSNEEFMNAFFLLHLLSSFLMCLIFSK